MQLPLKQCTIRSLRLGDAESLARHANNPKIARNMRNLFPHPYAVEDAVSFIDSVLTAPRECNFAIDVDAAVIGTIGLRLRTDVDRVGADMGYWIGETFWGRGIATEAVREFTPFALDAFELTRLEATVFEWNPASARVLEKAGYQLDATLRRSGVKNGRIFDRWLYSFVRE